MIVATPRVPETNPKEGAVKRSEKILAFLVATLFVGSLIFEGSMAMAIAHLKPFSKCTTCMGSSGGGGF